MRRSLLESPKLWASNENAEQKNEAVVAGGKGRARPPTRCRKAHRRTPTNRRANRHWPKRKSYRIVSSGNGPARNSCQIPDAPEVILHPRTMSEITSQETAPPIARPRMDADIVCVGFGPATAGFLSTLCKQLAHADGT